MHLLIKDWFRRLWDEHPALFHGTRVLECGSRMVPGGATISAFFADCEYTGLDAVDGPGVDIVGLVHEYRSERPFDVVVSCQMLEHDPHWRKSVARMVKLTKPGGALLLTFPTNGWPRHGVEDYGPAAGYYHNPDKEAVINIIAPAFEHLECETEQMTALVLALGRKAAA